jgi:hypothetical protein
MKHAIAVFAAIFSLVALTGRASAQETVAEPSTGKSFPTSVTITTDKGASTMVLTGLAVRKKFFFKVYGVAHYMQDPPAGSPPDVLQGVMVDGKAKQLTLDFARDVDSEKIRDAYADGFKENASKEELAQIQPLIDQFLGYFGSGVKENQVFVLRWLPGGVIATTVAGEEKPKITSVTFARVLWSFWLGDHAIVERKDLVSRIVK